MDDDFKQRLAIAIFGPGGMSGGNTRNHQRVVESVIEVMKDEMRISNNDTLEEVAKICDEWAEGCYRNIEMLPPDTPSYLMHEGGAQTAEVIAQAIRGSKDER